MRSAEIGPKTGPTTKRQSALATARETPKPASLLASRDGASRTRTGDLLGAMRSPALSLACLLGFRGAGARSEVRDFGQFPPISAGIGPKNRVFGPISDDRAHVCQARPRAP